MQSWPHTGFSSHVSLVYLFWNGSNAKEGLWVLLRTLPWESLEWITVSPMNTDLIYHHSHLAKVPSTRALWCTRVFSLWIRGVWWDLGRPCKYCILYTPYSSLPMLLGDTNHLLYGKKKITCEPMWLPHHSDVLLSTDHLWVPSQYRITSPTQNYLFEKDSIYWIQLRQEFDAFIQLKKKQTNLSTTYHYTHFTDEEIELGGLSDSPNTWPSYDSPPSVGTYTTTWKESRGRPGAGQQHSNTGSSSIHLPATWS